MTVREVADGLSVSPRTVRNWVSQRRIPHARTGRALRFHRVRIEEWLAGGGRHAPEAVVMRRPSASREGSALRDEMLRQRYLLKDSAGRVVESPRRMFARVARAVAAAEAAYGATEEQIRSVARQFCRMMHQGEFLPNSPTLMNAGRENGMLSACFVLPVPDSIGGIFHAVTNTALIQKAGGGTGFAFDNLRPAGDRVASSGGETSGPISFMRVFAETTRAIQQGASRRGANMGMMSVEHPDILKFILAKTETGAFANFNLSVKLTDAFMSQLLTEPGAPHVVTNPRTGQRYLIPRNVDPTNYVVQDLVAAGQCKPPCYTVSDVWELVVTCAHATGEPGICFVDRVNRANPTPALGRIEATNPCGEQPLLPYESCNLGSINLARFVDPWDCTVRWNELARAIRLAVRFLDDVVDANHYPLPKIRRITLGNRKIGLGVMGFADALVLLGMRYGTEEAVWFAEAIARFLAEQARRASERLAGERGCFPNWPGSLWDRGCRRAVRNATCTTVAPTGSISIIAASSSGIEPLFAVAAGRRILGNTFAELHPLVEEIGTREGWMTGRVRQALLAGVPPARISRFPRELASLLVTAHEVAPESHVRVQAAFQKHIDNAVSKTVNLPASAGREDVDRVFRLAYELGCKGITVYRDACREGQTLSSIKECRREPGVERRDAEDRTDYRPRAAQTVPVEACACCCDNVAPDDRE